MGRIVLRRHSPACLALDELAKGLLRLALGRLLVARLGDGLAFVSAQTVELALQVDVLACDLTTHGVLRQLGSLEGRLGSSCVVGQQLDQPPLEALGIVIAHARLLSAAASACSSISRSRRMPR